MNREAVRHSILKSVHDRMWELQVPKYDKIAPELALAAEADLPDECFDPPEAFSKGILIFRGDVDSKVAYLEELLWSAHLSLDKKKPISIHLSSHGGDIEINGFGLISTIQHIRRQKRVINIHIGGVAMSMASSILQCADHRTIEPYGFLMIHASRYDPGDQPVWKHEDDVKYVKRLDAMMDAMFTARTGKTLAYYRKQYERKDWYLSASQALSEGLVDRVVSTPPYPKPKIKKEA